MTVKPQISNLNILFLVLIDKLLINRTSHNIKTGKLHFSPFTLLSLTTATVLMFTEIGVTATIPNQPYNPIPLSIGKIITDTLSKFDIPMGQGGFARDYIVNLKAGEQVSIEAKSDSFDTLVSLIAANGTTVDENDDGPDEGTNSLLFARITKTGKYTVRVRSFGDKLGVGSFTLQVTRLRPESK
jgi:Bacterial pre-peptidase C-terminal domain